jgi:hypothetical protein
MVTARNLKALTSPELDAEIAVMLGDVEGPIARVSEGRAVAADGQWFTPEPYSTDEAQAQHVLDYLLECGYEVNIKPGEMLVQVELQTRRGLSAAYAVGLTKAEALCRAALSLAV